MNLIQYIDQSGERVVGVAQSGSVRKVAGAGSVYALAREAMEAGTGISKLIEQRLSSNAIDVALLANEGRLLSPIDHPDPAHLYITGTGLTHLGSAATRDSMHKKVSDEPETLTDSMKMFRMGLEAGKPASGEVGVQPEWFYKGNGHTLVAPGAAIPSPAFARDAGEEPEIAGIYVIDKAGNPCRLGFALGNEFSDHVTERMNYLYLAHSKLRACSIGPELRLGALPAHIEGTSRIWRDGSVLWEKPFLSGEDNMSHSIANLEHHHFKYELFRNPGDVHVHLFGTATLSFADGIATEAGDVFEISAPAFGEPLRNPLRLEDPHALKVRDIA